MTPQPAKPIVLTVRNCPECGCTHIAMQMLPLARPTMLGHTHGGQCPVTSKQILAGRTEEMKPQPDFKAKAKQRKIRRRGA